jgi:DnaK suppressor protein
MTSSTLRYSDQELLEFRELISEKLVKAQAEVNFIRSQMSQSNENSSNQQSGDWTDESSNHTEMELLNSMLSRQQQFLNNLSNALIRIQNKTYGVCTVTGQLIDKKRLQLVPHATKSVVAKSITPERPHERLAPANRQDEADAVVAEDYSTGQEISAEFYGHD